MTSDNHNSPPHQRTLTNKEMNCLFCSLLFVGVAVIVIPLAVVFGTKRQGKAWEPCGGSPLFPAGAEETLPNGTVALSANAQRLMVSQYDVATYVLELQNQTDQYGVTNPTYVQQSNELPGPKANNLDNNSTDFLQVASMSADGTTIAIGNPQALIVASTNDTSSQNQPTTYVATGTVEIYQQDPSSSDTEWKLVGNVPNFYDALEDNTQSASSNIIIAAGYYAAATALSQDGTTLAVGITQVQQGTVNNNDTASTVELEYYSYAQVLKLDSTNNQWTQVGNLIRGECIVSPGATTTSTGCVPCNGPTGPGERDFGQIVSLSADGTRLAVGAPQALCNPAGSDRAGFVRVYELDSNTQTQQQWVQRGKDIVLPDFYDENAFVPREFGSSVSLAVTHNGTLRVAVGSNAGAVVLEWDTSTTNTWIVMNNQEFKWSTSAAFTNEDSRVSLSADGSRVAVSGPLAETSGGRAEVWEWSGTSWSQVGLTMASNSGFGISIALAPDNPQFLALYGIYEVWVYMQ